jgi:hypothetical protein
MEKTIGVVRVPAVGVMLISTEWRRAFSYPEPSRTDWGSIIALKGSVPLACMGNDGRSPASEMSSLSRGQTDIVVSTSHCLRLARSLSFMDFLRERMMSEATIYAQVGIRHLILDFSVDNLIDEPVLYWMARVLADEFRNACGDDIEIGIRMDNDEWSADIGSRLGYNEIFCMDKCCASNASKIRNRLTDGTGKKKPVVFSCGCASNKYSIESVLLNAPEGIYVKGNNENGFDAIGDLFDMLNDKFGVRVLLAGDYLDEIVRGEMHYDMKSFGARDYVVIDASVRTDGCTKCSIDNERLLKACDEIDKFE